MAVTKSIGQVKLNEIVSEYEWTICNFCTLHDTKYVSEIFVLNGIKWRILMNFNGKSEVNHDYVSVSLMSNFKTIADCKLIASNDTKIYKKCLFRYTRRLFKISKFFNRKLVLADLKKRDDTLTILIKIVFSNVTQESCNYLNLINHISLLQKTKENADIILISSDKSEHKAHKAILACRSKVFSAMFHHNMRESQDNVVKIEDMDNETLNAMLHFVYTGELFSGNMEQDLFRRLLIAADKYELDDLRLMCINNLCANMDFDNVFDLIALADTYNIGILKLKTKDYFFQNRKEILTIERRENLKHLPRDIVEDLLCDLANAN